MLQAGMYAEAARAAVRISDPELSKQVTTLLAVIAYEQDDLPGESQGRRSHVATSHKKNSNSSSYKWCIFSCQ